MDRSKILEIVSKQLSLDMNCEIKDFLNEGIVLCEDKLNKGRRMFVRQYPFFEIATMGRGIVVSGDRDILTKVKPLLESKSREDIFVAPFIMGQPHQTLHHNL